MVLKSLLGPKENPLVIHPNVKQRVMQGGKFSIMRDRIAHIIYKSIGTPNFIRRIEWRSILEWLDPQDDDKVLDVACGRGILSLKIAERGCSVCAIDSSENAINSATCFARREKIACEFQIGDAECLPYPDGHFDKVVSSSSLEHFQDDLSALKEVSRVLKLGGTLVLTTDSFLYLRGGEIGQEHKKVANVVNYYDREKLNSRLEVSGFGMLRSKYLHKSPVASFFIKLGIKLKWSGLRWLLVSLVAYPLGLLSEKLFRKRDVGYTLLVEARKR